MTQASSQELLLSLKRLYIQVKEAPVYMAVLKRYSSDAGNSEVLPYLYSSSCIS